MLNTDPLIKNLLEEYLNHANGRNIVKETLLCHYKNELEKVIVIGDRDRYFLLSEICPD
jgi:hypothetical protein